MADDPLDIIAAERETLRKAFKKATKDEDKQAIQAQIDDLADLQEKVVLEGFQNEAAKIQAMSDGLNTIVQELRGHIDSMFLDDLKKIGTKIGQLAKKGQGGQGGTGA